jgi:hypothetical protein
LCGAGRFILRFGGYQLALASAALGAKFQNGTKPNTPTGHFLFHLPKVGLKTLFFWEFPVSGGVLTSGWKPHKRKHLMVACSTEFHLRLSSRLFDYALAVLSVLCMALVRLTLEPMIGKQLPYAFIPPAIIVSRCYGGLGPALLAMLLGFLAGSWLFSLHGRAFD